MPHHTYDAHVAFLMAERVMALVPGLVAWPIGGNVAINRSDTADGALTYPVRALDNGAGGLQYEMLCQLVAFRDGTTYEPPVSIGMRYDDVMTWEKDPPPQDTIFVPSLVNVDTLMVEAMQKFTVLLAQFQPDDTVEPDEPEDLDQAPEALDHEPDQDPAPDHAPDPKPKSSRKKKTGD